MSATVWTNVIVNHYYMFTGLTIGVLETFEIGDDLEALISVPGLSDLYEIKLPYGSDLISYKGIVTDVKDLELGIYEIDYKVSLYITFNISNTILSKGSEIFVSNAHLIQDYMVTLNSKVDSDDVQELLDSHNQELTIDELITMHEQEQEDIEKLQTRFNQKIE
ncbi:uncharacterized protein TNCV_1876911 [Trichonephila clavipes]|nr:uncharacterized protein TNCV_1876911 [Trichonephila clavipes]